MSFERMLMEGAPVDEAASFFLKLKDFSKTAAPDESGALEGQFTVPVEQVVELMTAMLENEYKTMYAYHAYAESLRGLAREGIAEEFEEHAQNELEHAEWLLRRMSVLAPGGLKLPPIEPPPPSSDPTEIVKTMIEMEQMGISHWQALHAIMGENPSKYEIENFLVREQHHLDELWQLMPAEEQNAGPMATNTSPVPTSQTPVADSLPGQATSAVAPEGVAAKTASSESDTGKSRGQASVHAHHERHDLTRGERGGEMAGKLVGALGGAAAGHLASRKLHGVSPGANAAMLLGGAVLGSHLAGQTGKHVGTHLDKSRLDKLSHVMKLAFEGVPSSEEYMAAESAGMEAEQQNEAQYFRQMAQQAKAEAAASAEQAQAAQQQIDTLQQQVSGNDMNMQAALQNAQMAQQGAMQNVQQAHQVASQAMQQALAAQDQSLQHQALAARMRIAFQEMRGNMMDLASKDPAADVGAELQQQGMPVPSSPQTGQPDPTQVEGQTTSGDQGPAAQAPQPEAAPNAAPPGGNPNEINQAPADNAGQAQGAPSGQALSGSPEEGGKGGFEVKVKQGSARDLAAGVGREVLKRAPYAAGGAALGAGLGALGTGLGSESQRQKIQELEAAPESYMQALNLAKAKALLAASEAGEKHPMGATIAGGLLGAGAGVALAPRLAKVPDMIRGIRG